MLHNAIFLCKLDILQSVIRTDVNFIKKTLSISVRFPHQNNDNFADVVIGKIQSVGKLNNIILDIRIPTEGSESDVRRTSNDEQHGEQ